MSDFRRGKMTQKVNVVGAGLAGSEAAYQLAHVELK